MTLTKNVQTIENLCRMTASAFPACEMLHACELTEGMCNAAYRIDLSDGRTTILKIAPANADALLRNEVALMAAEVRAMNLVRANTSVPVARVYAYDTSKTLCSSDYFFMEAMPGQSVWSLRDSLDAAQRMDILHQEGRVTRAIAAVHHNRFGFVGDETQQFDTLFDFVKLLLDNVLMDAAAKQVEIGVDVQKLQAALVGDRSIFDEVTTPSLIHWDMWDGNIFVQDGKISGIIDWERAMWSEPLGDDRFRRHNRAEDFLQGYGQTSFSINECRRMAWYDVILYLTMMTEGFYRGYADDSQYQWTKPLFLAAWHELQA